MPKPKQFTRPPKKPKPTQTPETADEFQEAADAHEERGGKWRAGDAAKSGRAFVCALEVYDAGLAKHPKNFDLAYNKARLQLEVAQQPSLVAHIGVPLINLLEETLVSHRYALSIDDANPDLLFNTSQVMTELAERLSDSDRANEAVPLLHEALERLSTCLSKQELMLEQHRTDFAQVEHDENGGGVALDPDEVLAEGDDSAEAEEQSATVEIPVTPQDLLDTVDTSLNALSVLVGLVDPSTLQGLGDMAAALSETKAPAYLDLIESAEERSAAQSSIALTRATFVAAFADAQYAASAIDLETYCSRLDAFNYPGRKEDAISLGAEAEARAELAMSVIARFEGSLELPAVTCWTQLSQAQELYARAVKMIGTAQGYMSRGDTEMLRHRLAASPTDKLAASVRKNAPLLAQNAQTYYRGAIKIASQDEIEIKSAAERRVSVVEAIRALLHAVPVEFNPRKAVAAIQEALDDGLISREWAERISSAQA